MTVMWSSCQGMRLCYAEETKTQDHVPRMVQVLFNKFFIISKVPIMYIGNGIDVFCA